MDWTEVVNFVTHTTNDWVLIGVVFILIAIDVLRAGTARVYTFALAISLTYLLYSNLWDAKVLDAILKTASPTMHAVSIGIIFLVSFLLIGRMGCLDQGGSGGPIQAFVAATAGTAMFILVWLHIPDLTAVWEFGPRVQAVWAEPYQFWWVLGSFTALTFIRR